MGRDREAFRNRFWRWKNGEKVYDNGVPAAILEVDKSDADFAKRLRSNWREEIWDWEKTGNAVTHKMAGFDNIVYPNVLTTKGGGLIDFTNPIWNGNVDPAKRALKNGDYVPMKTEQDAIWFGPNYKNYYPGFKNGKSISEIYDAGLPRYAGGSLPYDGYEQFVDDIIKEEGFLKHITDIGDGKQTLGSGLTNPKWHELYRKRGNVWSEQDNRNAVKYELGQIANYLRKIFPDYDKYPTGIQEVLLDIQYNTGKVNMKYSPKFVTAVKKGDWFEAARQMDWGNSDPVFGKGLRNRNRRRQQKLYQSLNLKEQPIVEQPDAIKPYPGVIPLEEVTTVYDPQLNRRFDPRPRLQIPTQITLPSLEQTMEETTWKPPVQLYSDGKEPKITKDRGFSRLENFERRLLTTLDNWILSMSPKQFSSYLTNGYANNMKPLFPKGLKDQKYAFTTFKCGKLPR